MGRHHRAFLPVLATATVAVLAVGCGSGHDTHGSTANTSNAAHSNDSPAKTSPDGKSSGAKDDASNDASKSDGAKGGTASGKGSPDSSAQDKSAHQDAANTSAGASAKAPWCGTGQLAVTTHGLNPGAGNRYAVVVLTNTSPGTCRTQGYIGMQLVSGSGSAVPTNVVRDHSRTAAPLTLASGQHAYARLHWGAVAGNGDSTGSNCQTPASRLEVTPPDSYSHEVVKWSYGPVCEKGRIVVLPLAAGTGPSY
jgi:Protein of unknown function (DUF4232)